MKNKRTIIISVISIIVACIIFAVFFYQQGLKAPSTQNDEDVIVLIEEGSSGRDIITALDEAGLIKNKLCAQIYLKLGSFNHLQANTYIFNQTMGVKELLSIIENPDFEYILKSKLTIIEGTTLPQVASTLAEILELEEKEVIKQLNNKDYLQSLIDQYWFLSDDILKSGIMYGLEGYLYPETYFITEQNPSLENIMKVVLDHSQDIYDQFKDEIAKTRWSFHEFMTLASIVEKESLFDEDKNMIAGVFVNRLEKSMLLQSDITVNYALQRTGVNVSIAQTQTDSPYNTYKYLGLPIGPVSNVSSDTMKRTLEYSDHDFIYFFADENGKVYYNVTYSDHQKTVEEYRWY